MSTTAPRGNATPPQRRRSISPEMARAVRQYSACTVLDELTPPQLRVALRLVAAHPDSQSVGYSLAKTARRNLETELTRRGA